MQTSAELAPSNSKERQRLALIADLLAGDPGTDRERWDIEFGAYLEEMKRWQIAGAEADKYYIEKSTLLSRACGLANVGDSVQSQHYASVTASMFEGFLTADIARKVYSARRLIWFAPVFISMGASERGGDVNKAFRSSRQDVLRLYGALDGLLFQASRIYH